MSSPPANTNVPQTPAPTYDIASLARVCLLLKQGMDSLGGYRGRPNNRAVTFDDLVTLGLATQQQLNSYGLGLIAPTAATAYTLFGFNGPLLTNSQVIFAHQFPQKVVFPADFGAFPTLKSQFGALVASTAAKTLNVQRCLAASDPTVGGNWSTVGTAVFGAGGYAATLATTGHAAAVFALGDYLRIVGPATADATLAQVQFALVGYR